MRVIIKDSFRNMNICSNRKTPQNLVVSPKTLIFAGVIEIKIKNYGKDH